MQQFEAKMVLNSLMKYMLSIWSFKSSSNTFSIVFLPESTFSWAKH